MRSLVLVPLAVIVAAAALVVGGYVLGTTQDEPADARDAARRPAQSTAAPAGAGRPDKGEKAPPLPSRTTTDPGHCDGALVEEEVREVTVPDGATCVLVDTAVASSVSVGHDAELALHRSRVGGDVEGEDARSVVAVGSDLSGNLQLEGGGTAVLSESHVDGDVEWQDQRGRLLLRESRIGGERRAGRERRGHPGRRQPDRRRPRVRRQRAVPGRLRQHRARRAQGAVPRAVTRLSRAGRGTAE